MGAVRASGEAMIDTLEKLGWDSFFQADLDRIRGEGEAEAAPARISADYGMQCDVITAEGVRRAELSGRLRFDLDDPEDAPAVGDWVALTRGDQSVAFIARRLKRKTRLVRQAPGKRPMPQVVGANLDVVFVVTSLNQEFNPRRLERYLTAIWDGGIQPVVVLNKADLVDDEEEQKRYLRASAEAAGEVEIITTIALEGVGIEKIARRIGKGKTAAFVGSSGVGKSTLVNALFGREMLATGDVRETDDRGRHTTTHRQLLSLPGGGVVIDTPGMREFHVWGAEEGVEDAFEDVIAYGGGCRFRDCEHINEPGCAVLAAVEAGELPAGRLASFQKLREEAREREEKKAQAADLLEKRRRKKRRKKR